MAPKCSELTAIFVHLHMKACGMNGVQTHQARREYGSHANGRNYKKSGLPNLFPNMLLKGRLIDI